jgi:hypothetical protein
MIFSFHSISEIRFLYDIRGGKVIALVSSYHES